MSRIHPLTIVSALACMAGFTFAAVSTSDFVAHLDRQVHGIHCSFLPGLAAADSSGASGCHATLMSPYSSILRESIWGGIPIALPAMAVFSFLAFWCIWLGINQRDQESRAAGFLFAGSLVPLSASAVMGYLSLVELDAACKLCIGIYASSGALSLASLLLWLRTKTNEPTTSKEADEGEKKAPSPSSAPLSWSTLGLAFAAGVTCVAISVGAYAASAPDFSTYVGSCGSIPQTQASAGTLIPLGPQKGAPEMLEVIDPLCPSCRAFEERFGKMSVRGDVDRKLLLFPLDESCNWMLDRSIHPGACSVSEAVLCASDPAPVLRWAFENQQRIMAAAEKDPQAAARMAKSQFPALAQCIGSAEAGAKLNQALRWAVKNQLPILTPQVFVEGTRLCAEDTDLGLDFALPRLIQHARNHPRAKKELIEEEPPRKAPAVHQAPRAKPDPRPAGDSEQENEDQSSPGGEDDPPETTETKEVTEPEPQAEQETNTESPTEKTSPPPAETPPPPPPEAPPAPAAPPSTEEATP